MLHGSKKSDVLGRLFHTELKAEKEVLFSKSLEYERSLWTNHGRPETHPNPHDHISIPNATGGTRSHGEAVPFKIYE